MGESAVAVSLSTPEPAPARAPAPAPAVARPAGRQAVGGVILPDVRGHMPALDGLRGIAVALVMLCHFLPRADQPTSLTGRLFFFIGRSGWSGVDLFFVLSGFLISGILLDAKRASDNRHYFRNFYARRTLRIFPLYYFVLAVIFLVVPAVWRGAFASPELAEIRRHQGWLWAYGTNAVMTWKNDMEFFYSGWLNLGPFWSLALEEHFYLAWPLIVFLCSGRALKRACAALILGSFVLRAALFLRGGWEWGIYIFTPCRIDALAIGGLLAVVLRDEERLAMRLLGCARWVALVLGIVTLAGLWKNPGRDGWVSMTAGYTLLAGFFAALLLAALAAPPGSVSGRVFNNRGLRTLGKYSYGLYVYHVVLGPAFDMAFGQRRLDGVLRRLHFGGAAYATSVLLFILLASAASFAMAFASWQLLEKQFLKLKRFFEISGRSGDVQSFRAGSE
jgi:peptidoglycan/LPS O-acetylase OafA/YrhL